VFDARAIVVAGMFSILLWAGCSPLVATVGVEDGEPDHDADAAVWIAPSDAAPSMGEGGGDAPGMSDGDGGGAAPSDAVTPPPNCVVLPDLVGIMTRTDGGVRALDNGVVWAATDQELGCSPVANTTTITYGRVDGRPLVTAGNPYALRWPGTPSMGTAQITATNLPCGEPLVFPFRIAVVFASFGDCAQPPAAQFLRFIVSVPTPFPSGLMLCDESVCP
jgi:hypothetical protein